VLVMLVLLVLVLVLVLLLLLLLLLLLGVSSRGLATPAPVRGLRRRGHVMRTAPRPCGVVGVRHGQPQIRRPALESCQRLLEVR
jgi:hypothetical protein